MGDACLFEALAFSSGFKNRFKVDILKVLVFLNFNFKFLMIIKRNDFCHWKFDVCSLNSHHFLGNYVILKIEGRRETLVLIYF